MHIIAFLPTVSTPLASARRISSCSPDVAGLTFVTNCAIRQISLAKHSFLGCVKFDCPSGITVYDMGTIYVSDTRNHRIVMKKK